MRQDLLQSSGRRAGISKQFTSKGALFAAAIAAVVSPALAVPVIDGTRDVDYGAATSVQTVNTEFGDNQSELDASYTNITNGRLSLFFSGNLESNYNKLVVFLDTKAGGQNTILASGPIDDKYTGMTFDTGFSPDYAIILNRGNEDNSFYVDFHEMTTAGPGFGGYAGKITVPGPSSGQPQIGAGFLSEGAPGMPAIELGYNDANVLGIGSGSGAADQTAAADVSTGTEFAMDLSALGITGNFKMMTFINGSGHDYASNQFLPGLPAPQGNLGGDGTGAYTGTLSGINLGNYAGDQFVEVSYTGTVNDWALASGGNWNTAANWSAGVVPNGPAAQAVLAGPAGSGTRVITLDPGVTVQQIKFNNASASYELSGTAALNINANPLLPSLVVASGSHRITAPVVFNNAARLDVAAGGQLTMSGPVTATGLNLFVGGGGAVQMTATSVNSITVNAGSLKFTGGGHSAVRGVTVDTGATFDLGSTALLIDYDDGFSPMDAIRTAISEGRILSSSVTSASRAIGYADTAQLVSLISYDGVPLDATALVFVATLKGDTNLDKTVNFTDLLALAQNYGGSGTLVWTQGDSNNDGAVTFADLLALAQNYGQTALEDGSILVDDVLAANFASHWALAQSMVPEPASLSLLALGGVMMRRRK